MHLKIDWASLIVGSKFTVFALFYFVFEGNFQVQDPRVGGGGGGGGAYIWRVAGEFFALRVWGAYIWRAYIWRGLFSEFYGINLKKKIEPH